MSEFIIQDVTLTEIANAIRGKTSKTEDILVSDFADEIASISSGTELNFEVVGGTTAPTNPKENTIWIDTDADITQWAFAADNPYFKAVEVYSAIGLYSGSYMDSSGRIITSSDWTVTGKITLPANTVSVTIPTDYNATTDVYHGFYDANGSVISYVKRNATNPTYKVPSGASEIMASIAKTDPKSIIANVAGGGEQGNVWISIGTESRFEFNALTENCIQVYPLSAKQYVSGAWVNVSAMIYQNGEWVDWVTYIYNKGNDCEILTGGWVDYVHIGGTTYSKGTCTNTADGFLLQLPGDKTAIARQTVNKIDLTHVSCIKVYPVMSVLTTDIWVADSSKSALIVSGNFTTTAYARGNEANNIDNPIILDVSAFSGEYYFGVGVYSYISGAGTTKIISVVLE